MTEKADQLTDTHREMTRRRIGAGDARVAVIRRRYDADIEDVWDACTNPDRLRRWFLPVSGDLRAGGTFDLEGNAHGDIVRCEPPRHLALTWIYGDRPVDEVELHLSASAEGGTILQIEHASVSTSVEWEGQMYDVIAGVGTGWEIPLTYSLPALLRDELPDAPPDQAVLDEIAGVAERAWNAVVEAASQR